MAAQGQITKPEFIRILRRAGYPQELIEEIAAQLGDPVDTVRDAPILRRYGLTRGDLMDMMGASP